MESGPKNLTTSEAFEALARRGWIISEADGALTCTHQDGSKFVVRNTFVRTEGFDREQLLDRMASALVNSVGCKHRGCQSSVATVSSAVES